MSPQHLLPDFVGGRPGIGTVVAEYVLKDEDRGLDIDELVLKYPAPELQDAIAEVMLPGEGLTQ
jgi:hypothetical protein